MPDHKPLILTVVTLFILLTAACTPGGAAPVSTPVPPVAAAPTAAPTLQPTETATPALTSTPTTTPLPTATPTATATSTVTPTPIPTIQVGDITFPDPHDAAPELFDLNDPHAPIPQFTHAMQEAGIALDNQEVAEGLEYSVIHDKDGNQVIVAIFNVDPNSNEKGDLLEGPIPLYIAQQDENGRWKWGKIGLKDIAPFPIGDSLVYKKADHSLVKSPNYHSVLAKNYSVLTIAQGNYWKWFERKKDVIDPWSKADIEQQIQIIKEMKKENPKLKVRISPFGSFAESNPDWLQYLSPDEAKQQIRQHMQDIYDLYVNNGLQPDEYVVVNEPYFNGNNWTREDALYEVLGYEYVPYAFQIAREIVGPDPLLIYNDTANNSSRQVPYNYYTDLTKKMITMLRNAGVEDFAVGLQMHLRGDAPIDEKDLIQTMRSYGVPVVITELDVSVSMLPLKDRSKALIDIYTSVFRAAIQSGVCKEISTWNGIDDLSTSVDYQGKEDSPCLFYDSITPNPKPAYYAVLKVLFEKDLETQATTK